MPEPRPFLSKPARICTAVYVLLCLAYFAFGAHADSLTLEVVAKVLPIAALIVYSLAGKPREPLMLAALAFSLLGDIAGELPLRGNSFVSMLALFALAQLLYTTSFSRHHRRPVSPSPGSPVVSSPGSPVASSPGSPVVSSPVCPGFSSPGSPVVSSPVCPGDGDHRRLPFLPTLVIIVACILALAICAGVFVSPLVGLYVGCILAMATSAAAQNRPFRALFIAGAIAFIISDSLIGIRLLGITFPHRPHLIMLTYYLAQYLLNLLPTNR